MNKIMNGNKLLFWGELAPNIIHGISLANKLNLDILNKYINIDIIEEQTKLNQHKNRSLSKVKNVLLYSKQIYILNKKEKYNSFYSVFAFTTFGILKNLVTLLAFYVSGKGEIVLHIHRGDFNLFYTKNLLNKILVKIVFSLLDKLIVLSKNQKKEFSNLIDKKKIFVVENSLNEEYIYTEKENRSKNFIYISNYIKEKGIFELLEVFSLRDDIYLECFGGFTTNETLIRNFNKKNISINSSINGIEKYKKLHNSNALILPSWNEGQPTILLEAMMTGTIVLTTKVGLISELLGEDYPFYFEPKNIDSLELCIEKFLKFNKKVELSYKLKKTYWNKYSRQLHQEKIKQVFYKYLKLLRTE